MNSHLPTLLALMISATFATAATAGSECEDQRHSTETRITAKIDPPPPVKARRVTVPATPRRGTCNRPFALAQCSL